MEGRKLAVGRLVLAALPSALGAAALLAHRGLPIGHGRNGTIALIGAGLRPQILIPCLLFATVVFLLGVKVSRRSELAAGWTRLLGQCLVSGFSASLLAALLDPFAFRCTASVFTALGIGAGALVASIPSPLPSAQSRRIVVFVVVVMVPALLLPEWPGPDGDEPHYLLVAQSLVDDGDLDLAADYGNARYRPYFDGFLSPHYKPGARPGSRYSMHGVGYPMVLAVVHAAVGWIGPTAVIFVARLVQIVAVAIFALVLLTLLESIVGRRGAVPATLVCCCLAPVVFAPLSLFPEALAMTLACSTFVILRQPSGIRGLAAAALMLAVLPWLGIKYLPLAGGLAAVGILCPAGASTRLQRARWLAGAFVVSGTAHVVFTLVLYDSMSPAAVYLGANSGLVRQPGFGDDWAAYFMDLPGAFVTVVGYFIDQREGLLAVAPHFVLGAVGLPWLWRQRRVDLLCLMLPLLAYIGPYALSQQLGGQSPPARPLMAVVWIIVVPIAVALRLRIPAWLAILRGGLLALGVGLTLLYAVDPSRLPHDYGVVASRLLSELVPEGMPVWSLFPVVVGDGSPVTFSLWVGGLLSVAILLWRTAARASFAGDARVGWRAAWLAMMLLVGMWFVRLACIPVSGRHRGLLVAEGVTAWAPSSIPKQVWLEEGGVWARPGPARRLVLTTERPLQGLRVVLRTLVSAQVGIAIGGRAHSVVVAPDNPVSLFLEPGPGWLWRGGRAYGLELWSSDGVILAETVGDGDWRNLGVHLRIASPIYEPR